MHILNAQFLGISKEHDVEVGGYSEYEKKNVDTYFSHQMDECNN